MVSWQLLQVVAQISVSNVTPQAAAAAKAAATAIRS
jgi:hypothetical protein